MSDQDDGFLLDDDDGESPVMAPVSTAVVASDEEAEQILVTKEGLKQLKEELHILKTVKRKEVAERLKEAISYGDLSENAEYEEAKNEQAFVEGRILELENNARYAKIIEETSQKGSGAVVQLG